MAADGMIDTSGLIKASNAIAKKPEIERLTAQDNHFLSLLSSSSFFNFNCLGFKSIYWVS